MLFSTICVEVGRNLYTETNFRLNLNVFTIPVRAFSFDLAFKVLKMYAWELSFMKKVKEIRDKELNTLSTNAILMAISTAVCTHGQYLVRLG